MSFQRRLEWHSLEYSGRNDKNGVSCQCSRFQTSRYANFAHPANLAWICESSVYQSLLFVIVYRASAIALWIFARIQKPSSFPYCKEIRTPREIVHEEEV